jgi:hypothetical protein
MAARNQIRRLPHARPARPWRPGAPDPQWPQLDRQISADRGCGVVSPRRAPGLCRRRIVRRSLARPWRRLQPLAIDKMPPDHRFPVRIRLAVPPSRRPAGRVRLVGHQGQRPARRELQRRWLSHDASGRACSCRSIPSTPRWPTPSSHDGAPATGRVGDGHLVRRSRQRTRQVRLTIVAAKRPRQQNLFNILAVGGFIGELDTLRSFSETRTTPFKAVMRESFCIARLPIYSNSRHFQSPLCLGAFFTNFPRQTGDRRSVARWHQPRRRNRRPYRRRRAGGWFRDRRHAGARCRRGGGRRLPGR